MEKIMPEGEGQNPVGLLILIVIGAGLFYFTGSSVASRLSEISPTIWWIIAGVLLISLLGGKKRR
jgi:hypothetical protein